MKKALSISIMLFFCLKAFAQTGKGDVIGIYQFSEMPGEEVEVFLEGESLFLRSQKLGKHEMKPGETSGEFSNASGQLVIRFKPEQVGLKTPEGNFTGRKVEPVLSDYTGFYAFAEDSPVQDLIITEKEGELFGKTESGTSDLKKTGKKDTFLVASVHGEAVFSRDQQGKVAKVVLYVQGFSLEGQKKLGQP